MQADLLTKVLLPLSLFLIMFGLGLSLHLSHFKEVLTSPKAIAIGLIGQLLLLPVLAFVVASVMQLQPEFAVGLLIISLAPSGVTSNIFTYLFKGDVSLSISLTAIVSLVTPFTIPLVVGLLMEHFMGASTALELPLLKTIVQLLVITLIPVMLGMFVLSHRPLLAGKIEQALKWYSVLFLLLIITLIVHKNADNMASFFAQAGLPTLILNMMVLALGYQLASRAGLSVRQTICISFEIGIQNGTLALVVAGTLIGSPTMMIPAVTYSLIMLGSGTLFGLWVSRRASS